MHLRYLCYSNMSFDSIKAKLRNETKEEKQSGLVV